MDTKTIVDVIKVLYPSRYVSRDDNRSAADGNKQRFSTLLLEHGEQQLQDWGVIASSSPLRRSKLASSNGTRIQKEILTSSSYLLQSSSSKSSRSFVKNNRRFIKAKEPYINMSSVQGRLRLCSKSIVFEPNDISKGVIRLPFDKMIKPPTIIAFNSNLNDKTIAVQFKRVTVMKKNNIISPYEYFEKKVEFTFTFEHSTAQNFMDLFAKLFRASPLDLEQIMKPLFDQPFDPSNFFNMNEQPRTNNLRVFMLAPLVKTAGCAILTETRIYFQPFNGVQTTMSNKALSWALSDIVATARRYHRLRDEALELFFDCGPSILFAFDSYKQREEIYRLLPKHRIVLESDEVVVPCHTDTSFLYQTILLWKRGDIDNFEYLLALNSAAGRSYLDLSRYPVFPWVLADYSSAKLDWSIANGSNESESAAIEMFRDLSKPVGALNEERLKSFRARFESMKDDANPEHQSFLYGTHYSAPGYCLYYLVRSMPEHMLCLQNGKYDAPDRLFHAMSQCYASLLTNPADVKESIPQFFDSKSVDILLNLSGLQLGVTQNGTVLDDIELPRWAKSPKEFLKMNRKALESEYCSQKLPLWIDLIFGVKARGDEALKAHNVFHPTSYLSPKDVNKMKTYEERMQAEFQAVEFGICPDVLFSAAHPKKTDKSTHRSILADAGRVFVQDTFDESENKTRDGSALPKLHQVSSPQKSTNTYASPSKLALATSTSKLTEGLENEDVPALMKENLVLDEGSSQGAEMAKYDATCGENELKVRTLSLRGNGEQRENKGTRGTFGAEELLSPRRSALLAERKHSFRYSDKEWSSQLLSIKEMHGGAVSGCCLSINDEKSFLVTTSLDGSLMVHTLQAAKNSLVPDRRSFIAASLVDQTSNRKSTEDQRLHPHRSHHSSDPLACLALVHYAGGHIAFAGSHDDVVLAYGINSACGLASVYSHRDAIRGVTLIPRPPGCKFGTHLMLTASWDATVKVWGVRIMKGEKIHIEKDPVVEFFDADTSIDSLDAISILDLGIAVAAGGTDGSLIVWLWRFDGSKEVIFREESTKRGESCSALKWLHWPNGDYVLFAGFRNCSLNSYIYKKTGMIATSKLNLGSPVSFLV
uniref:BEACH domain-containing protein n=1 Tax=Chaetoceros debilis TaxID=122233 RepID=A0A7S3V655_9STRA